jgi:hypothetical protein
MKKFTAQIDNIVVKGSKEQVWLKNVIPNSLGYLERYIELDSSLVILEELFTNIWVEFEGVDPFENLTADNEFMYGLEIQHPMNIRRYQ